MSSANSDALLLIVQMRKFTQLTALRFALAFLLKARKTSAVLANISTMLNANASVPHKFAPWTIIGTPELVVAPRTIFFELDIDFDSDFSDESWKLFDVYAAIFVCTSENDLFDLVECLDSIQRRLNFNSCLKTFYFAEIFWRFFWIPGDEC